ncbi:alpha/beta fold hydrolase [Pseudomonas sp. UL073]|uniref:Alpha/beta fold hydrolase n=1 Tax=Zestomonas insulae TaxID=2809017 RepID=A0ABS2IGF8_9GAMM|nr:alpha/beta fold hydrolase [Pseudomonas insulae]MBM7061845.1 alpha/beta fold hydrolase [Pseudomonas insulae]
MTAALDVSAVRHVQARGLRFRVFEQGQGTPVLLLHGFPDSLETWAQVAPVLRDAGYRVVAFDQRGFAGSDAPAGTASYRMQELVDDVPALLDALGIHEPVHVMGHDWGSMVAWGVALAHPARVRALVTISVGHPQSYGRAGLEQKLGKGLYVLWFQLRRVAESYLLRAGGMQRWLGGGRDAQEVVAQMQRPGRLTAALNWYRANLLPILFRRWPRCQRPTLGIWSSEDAYLAEGQMRDSQRYVDAPWAYQRIEACGHWVQLEQPQRLAELAIDWFRQHPGR